MTLEKAIQLLHRHKDAPPALLAYAQSLSDRATTQAADGALGMQSALGMLNRLVTDAEQKKDLECRECSNFQETQWRILEGTRQELSVESADVAQAHRGILEAESEIEELKTRVSSTQEMLSVLHRKCTGELVSLRGQLDVLLKDLDFMERTNGSSWCRSQRLFLVRRCNRTLAAEGGEASARPLLLATASARHQVEQGWTPKSSSAQRSGCSLKRNPSCEHVRDHFLRLRTETTERRDALREELQTASSSCEQAKRNYQSQIEHLEAQSRNAQTRLAAAMARQNMADEHLHIKARQLHVLESQRASMARQCFRNVGTIEHKICGLRKIRDEMEKLQGKDTYILDCQVSKWVREECSATCGGGTQKITRSILVHPMNGAACPPLEGIQRCAEEPCPVHCRLDDWSGWSGCSANCGGGVRERIRAVAVKPRHGGQPCSETVETQACGEESCDRDCALAPWGPWSACSRGCGGGLQSRHRHVASPAAGAGTCPGSRSHLRLQYLACNTQVCSAGASAQPCQRKLDVVLLLDGGAQGWQQVKQAAGSLATALDGGGGHVQLAVQLFGGPRSLAAFSSCTGSAGPQANFSSECGIKWVSHLSPSISAIASQISQQGPLGGSPLTSAALALAQEELSLGRSDARRIVVVVTDRMPVDPTRTEQAAAKLQKQARLMWIPMSPSAPVQYMKTMASRPVRDNLLFVQDFALLPMASTVEAIVGSICPPLQR